MTIAEVSWKCLNDDVQTFLTDKPGLTGVKKSAESLSPWSAGASMWSESIYFSASKMKSDNAIPQSPKALSVESVYFNEAEAIDQLITIILVTQLSLLESLLVPCDANT